MNFGIFEVTNINTKAAPAPGWAYVPDNGPSTITTLQPSGRNKRARTQTNTISFSETTAKQDNKILREIEELQKDGGSSTQIIVPGKAGGREGARGAKTPATRKILASQKTFQNHLEDYHAWKLLAPTTTSTTANTITIIATPVPSTPVVSRVVGRARGGTPHLTASGKRSHKKKPDPNALPLATPVRKASSAVSMPPPPPPVLPPAPRVILDTSSTPQPASHPKDNDVLLVSRVPVLPTQAQIDKLVDAPALSYVDAKGGYIEGGNGEGRGVARVFCEVCGYWGRVRCSRCKVGRACGLECLKIHEEECQFRYGA